MELTFQTIGTNTFLNVELCDKDEIDSMSLGMLTNNKIQGLAETSYAQMDVTRYIKYNVTAKVSVSQLFNGPVNKKRLIGVFRGIVDAMLSAEEYMLDPNSILLDLDYIFADVTTCETVLICLPVVKEDQVSQDLGMFFKNIIFKTQFDQTENCDHVAKILNYLNSTPVLSLVDFKNLLESIGKGQESVKPVQPKVTAAEAPQPAEKPAAKPQPAAVNIPAANAVKNQVQPQVTPQSSSYQFSNNSQPVPQPAAPIKTAKVSAPAMPQAEGEKPISMFYLLQHYNKDNAAKYKAQQAAKKAQKGSEEVKEPKPQKAKKSAPKQVNTNFAIPGQQSNPGFAIPGQQSNPGFAIPGQQVPVAPKPVQPVVKADPKPVVQQVQAAPVYQQPIIQPSQPINFGETTLLGGAIGETTVLSSASDPVKEDPYLIRVKNNEKIPLNKPVFRIGKERSYVDYFIGDNTAISRSHANIVNHDGEFFVVDTNSTNHTYVNGGMIQSNVETKLSHGTKIRLANEDFEFRLY